jgi:hypothetical protein
MPGSVQLFLFGLFLAWFVGKGKARNLLIALQTPVTQTITPAQLPSYAGGGDSSLPSYAQ